MIFECSHCQGLVRIEENKVSLSKKVKIRCPHCSGTGFVQINSSPPRMTEAYGLNQATGLQGNSEGQSVKEEISKTVTVGASDNLDPPFPQDAFQAFRFPLEQGIQKTKKRHLGSGVRLLLLGALSLGVIAFFAALVNFVLPGPVGPKPLHSGSYQETSPSR